MRSPSLVLITGATGHIGFCTLLHLLRAGHHVRAAVRSEAKAAFLRARPQVQGLNGGGHLTFAIVPDITAPGAYDAAIDGVTHVLHIASPLVTGDRVPPAKHAAYFLRPAVRGTLGMLDAAARAGSVRRVVVTSSIAALTDLERPLTTYTVLPEDRIENSRPPFASEFAAYAASKATALRAAEAWAEAERPAFDIVHLHPGFVLGRNDAATTPADALRGTNALVFAMLLGKTLGPYAGCTVHVQDVARAHVLALDPVAVPGGQSYILSRPTCWDDAKHIVRRRFPDAIASRVLVATGGVETIEIAVDTSLSEETFGFEFASFEEQVCSVVEHFLELRADQKRPSLSRISSSQSTAARGVQREVKASA